MSNRFSQLTTSYFDMFLLWSAVIIMTGIVVFVLPFSYPPRIAAESTAYATGFNNSVATVGTVCISLMVTVFLRIVGIGANIDQASSVESPRKRWLGYAAVTQIAFTSILGALVTRADVFFGDAGLFQHNFHNGGLGVASSTVTFSSPTVHCSSTYQLRFRRR